MNKILKIYDRVELGFIQEDKTDIFFPYEEIIKCLEELREIVEYDYILLGEKKLKNTTNNEEQLKLLLDFATLLSFSIRRYKLKATTKNNDNTCIDAIERELETDKLNKYISYREKIRKLRR